MPYTDTCERFPEPQNKGKQQRLKNMQANYFFCTRQPNCGFAV
jgi:hypothetical protein